MKLNFKTKVWIWDGPITWYFVTIPQKESVRVREKFRNFHRGWGSIPVNVRIGKSEWKTSIFWEKKGTYLLPIKKEIRKAENISNGSLIHIRIQIDKLI